MTDERKPRVWVVDYSAPPGERVRLCVPLAWDEGRAVAPRRPLTWYEDVVTARCERTSETDE